MTVNDIHCYFTGFQLRQSKPVCILKKVMCTHLAWSRGKWWQLLDKRESCMIKMRNESCLVSRLTINSLKMYDIFKFLNWSFSLLNWNLISAFLIKVCPSSVVGVNFLLLLFIFFSRTTGTISTNLRTMWLMSLLM